MDDLKNKISKKLDSEGINHAKLGYRYLVKAIEIELDNPSESIKLTSVFKKIEEQSQKNSSSIERAIRYVIKPTGLTTKEFIMKVADSIYFDSFRDNICQNSGKTENRIDANY